MRVAGRSAAVGARRRSPGPAAGTATRSTVVGVVRRCRDHVRRRPRHRRPRGRAGRRRSPTTCAARRHPVLRPDRRARPAESRRRAFTRDAGDAARHPVAGVPPPPTTPSEAIAWWRELGRPVVVKLDGLAAGKGVVVPADARRDRGRDPRARRRRADRARGAPQRPGVLAARAVRRRARRAAADRPGPQAHRRGRHRPEHRRDGRLRPGAGRRTTADELTATFVQPVLDHLAARRHAVRRRALRRADAHRRRPAAARVQLPLRRPRDAGGAAAARRATCAELALEACTRGALARHRSSCACRRGVHRGRRRARLPAAPEPGATVSDVERRRPTPTLALDALRLPRRTSTGRSITGGRRARRHRAGRRPRRGARTRPTHAWRRSRFDGMQVRRDIGWRARAARRCASYAAAGVDIDEGNARRRADEGRASSAPTTPAVLARRRRFGGVFDAAALVAMDEPVLVASTDGVGTKVELAARAGRPDGVGHGHRQPLHRRRPRAGRAAAVLPRLHRRQPSSTPTMVAEVVDRHGRGLRGRRAARCSAARRRRCPASTRPARSTSPARSSAWSNASELLPPTPTSRPATC